jgi:GGDEF domain-containing protein
VIASLKADIVSSADRQRFDEFSNPATLKERVENSEAGYIENVFRMKQNDGSYKWAANVIMMIPGTGGREFMVCIRTLPEKVKDTIDESGGMFKFEDYGLKSDELELYSKLFMNFVANSSVKFFWKDKNRNFIGASQAFLDFFGITSVDAIKGKPSEKQNWLVDKERSIKEDTAILTKGETVDNAPSQYIINGVIHNTICNKAPVYSDGKIVGIMGYLIDIGEELSRMDSFYQIDTVDKVTGLMSIRAFLSSMVDYSIQYTQNAADYGVIILKNVNHERIEASYGKEFSDKVLKAIADKIVEATGSSSAICRVRKADFALITHASALKELEIIAASLKKRIEAIKAVGGKSVTLKMITATALRSEDDMEAEGVYHTALTRLK